MSAQHSPEEAEASKADAMRSGGDLGSGSSMLVCGVCAGRTGGVGGTILACAGKVQETKRRGCDGSEKFSKLGAPEVSCVLHSLLPPFCVVVSLFVVFVGS